MLSDGARCVGANVVDAQKGIGLMTSRRRVSCMLSAVVLFAAAFAASPAGAAQGRRSVRLAAGGDQTIILYPGSDGAIGILDWRGNSYIPFPNNVFVGAMAPSGSRMFAVSAGSTHSLLLSTDGYVYAGGRDDFGQIGERSTIGTTESTGYQLVGSPGGYTAVSAGAWHSLLLRGDGTVQAMGLNQQGQLGRADGVGASTPQPSLATVAGISDAVAVSAGTIFSMVVRQDGTVWSWGANNLGQLGRPENLGVAGAPVITPGQVTGLTDVVDIAAGNSFTYALRRDGTVWSWGLNDRGQLGYGDDAGTLTPHGTPKQIPGLAGIVAVATGRSFGAALGNDGTVFTWGDNTVGQLARSTSLGSYTTAPASAALPGKALAIAAGNTHLAIAMEDGTVRAHGASASSAVPPPGGVAGGTYQNSPPARSFVLGTSRQPLGAFSNTRLATGQSGTGAALLNLTMTEGVRVGYITADRCSALVPGPQTKSNGNYTPGTNIANLAVVPFDADGAACIVNEQPVNLIADLQGAFTPSATDRLTTVAPVRLLDSRSGVKPDAGTIVRVVTGQPGASSALINLTMTEADTAGYVTADRCSALVAGPQTKSNGNYTPGTNIANLAVVPLDPDGSFCVYTERSTHLLVDLQGTFAPSGTDRLTTAAARVIDTRAGAKPAAGSIVRVVTGQPGASSALINLTMTEADTAGYVTADRCSALVAGPQTKSNGNYTPGTNIANLAVVPLDPDGSFCVYTERSTHLLVDLQGTFAPSGTYGFQRVEPTRLIDTRVG